MKRLINMITVIVIMAVQPTAIALAAEPVFEENFYSGNEVRFYDPRDVPCTQTTASVPTTSGTSADEDKNAETVLRYLTGQMGMTLIQASGFVGNMHAESNIDPRKIQGGAIATEGYVPVDSVGFGLIQWTFTSRQQPLVDLALSTSSAVTDINVQLAYVNQELNGAWKSTLMALDSTPDLTPEKAAIIVHGRTPNVKGDSRFDIAPELGYEASGDTADGIINNRAAFAQKYYDMYKTSIPDGSGIAIDGGSTSVNAKPNNCAGSSGRVASGECTATAPIYGAGGNGHQLTIDEMTTLYGPPNDGANMVNVDFLGRSVQVSVAVSGCLSAVSNELTTNGETYTINQMGCYRSESLDIIKYHGFGAACDINPDTNPCVYAGGGWCYRSADGSTNFDMPQTVIDAFRNHGWSWGGDWGGMKDYMHFEYNGTSL